MKRLLINDTFPGERRIALIDGQKMVFFEYEHASDNRRKGNIYNAVVESIEESLEAAFVNYGTDKRGFLPFSAIAGNERQTDASDKADEDGNNAKPTAKGKKKSPVKLGQKLLVQVEHDERDNKGAALTNRPTLAGSCCVLSPNNPKAGGISRQISGSQRDAMREKLDQIELPEGMGVIMRTAGISRSIDELRWDIECQVNLWRAIEKASAENPTPALIYREDDALFRAVRDNLRHDIDEVIVDNEDTFKFVSEFIKDSCPSFTDKITHYQSNVPLFTHYQIEEQINNLDERDVPLPSGGRLVFDKGEALTAIDVNSASTKGKDIEDTALQTNLESADEIAHQLQLRDIGGLVVIDFIDMTSKRNRDAVEKRLEKALSRDRARIQTTHISRLGLVELSRQRITSAIGEQGLKICPHCDGRGSIRSVELFASTVLRAIEEQAIHTQSTTLQVQLPLAVATYLLNEKRNIIQAIETRQQASIMLIPNPHFDIPKYQIKRIRQQGNGTASYEATYNNAPELEVNDSWQRQPSEKAAVSRQHAQQSAAKKAARPGLIKRLWSSIQADSTEEETTSAAQPHRSSGSNTRNRTGSTGNRRRRPDIDSRTRTASAGNRNRRGSGARSNPRNEHGSNPSRRRSSPRTEQAAGNIDENIGNRIEPAEAPIDDNIGNRIDEPAKKSTRGRRGGSRTGGQSTGRSNSQKSGPSRGGRRPAGGGGNTCRQRRVSHDAAPLSDTLHDDLETL